MATAVAVLAVVVVGIGGASYVALSVLGDGHSSSSTVHACHPAGSPACTASGNSTRSQVPAFSAPIGPLIERA
ncbi:MAG TPA: hypothetical protein VEE83_00400 [Thermoplasmata archaeon]|nr:hypothetical protein [Thermoplasmata archaeon]